MKRRTAIPTRIAQAPRTRTRILYGAKREVENEMPCERKEGGGLKLSSRGRKGDNVRRLRTLRRSELGHSIKCIIKLSCTVHQ